MYKISICQSHLAIYGSRRALIARNKHGDFRVLARLSENSHHEQVFFEWNEVAGAVNAAAQAEGTSNAHHSEYFSRSAVAAIDRQESRSVYDRRQ